MYNVYGHQCHEGLGPPTGSRNDGHINYEAVFGTLWHKGWDMPRGVILVHL